MTSTTQITITAIALPGKPSSDFSAVFVGLAVVVMVVAARVVVVIVFSR